jgi:hypothetical protein
VLKTSSTGAGATAADTTLTPNNEAANNNTIMTTNSNLCLGCTLHHSPGSTYNNKLIIAAPGRATRSNIDTMIKIVTGKMYHARWDMTSEIYQFFI